MFHTFKYFLILAAALFLIACESYSDGGLAGDAMNDKVCPPGCVESQVASSETLFVKIDNSSTLKGKTGEKLEVIGQCRTLYSNSTITFKLLFNGSTPFSVPVLDVLSSTESPSTTVSCYDGRFHAMISLSGVGSANYTLQADIHSLSAEGLPVVNTISGVSRVPVQITN